jgi:vanillate monooxygenase ferredoxin subunit
MLAVAVTAKTWITADVVKLQLSTDNGSALPDWQAGAHITLHLPTGISRQYSLLPTNSANCYEVAVKYDSASRGGSAYIHQHLQSGDRLHISGPMNVFPLVQGQAPIVFLAAGIGITPIIAMLSSCLAARRAFHLYYCVKDPLKAALTDTIMALDLHDRYTLYSSKHNNGNRLNFSEIFKNLAKDSLIYCCGPAQFTDEIIAAASHAGFTKEAVHYELFQAAALSAEATQQAFEIEIASTGQILTVPVTCSIAEVLEEHDIFIPLSCEQGICGTCRTGVLNGQPLHRDHYLSDEEKASGTVILPCCSRANSQRLTLDL